MRFGTFSLSLVATILFSAPAFSATKSPSQMLLCSNASTGAIVARAKCKKNETLFNLSTLQSAVATSATTGQKGDRGETGQAGPQGPAGPVGPEGLLNLTSCHVVTATDFADNGTASAYAGCNASSEFMLTWGYTYQDSALVVLRDAILNKFGNSYAVGVSVITQNDFGVPITNTYTLIVNAVCCAA
jgi:hypothetical protein